MKLALLLLAALPAFSQQDTLAISAPPMVRPGAVLDITLRRTSTVPPPVSAGTQLMLAFSGPITTLTIDGAPPGSSAACNITTGKCILYGALNMPDGIVAVIHATLGTTQAPNFTITASNPISSTGGGATVLATVNPSVSVSVQSKCDLNGDGLINPVDVGIAKDQAIGPNSATGSANVDGIAGVDVRDVEWIIAATLPNGICR